MQEHAVVLLEQRRCSLCDAASGHSRRAALTSSPIRGLRREDDRCSPRPPRRAASPALRRQVATKPQVRGRGDGRRLEHLLATTRRWVWTHADSAWPGRATLRRLPRRPRRVGGRQRCRNSGQQCVWPALEAARRHVPPWPGRSNRRRSSTPPNWRLPRTRTRRRTRTLRLLVTASLRPQLLISPIVRRHEVVPFPVIAQHA
jgi:hypothetical protein